ncbi:MAG: TolC family protein [Myxococcota bacterium]|jgi:cobalt-zinc-cadmium efflux system outer membrane protein|nr:TolC family protein [Myxococcota bacterium]
MRSDRRRVFWSRRGAFLFLVLQLARPALAEPVSPITEPRGVPGGLPPPVQVTWPDLVRLVDEHPRLAAGKLQIEAAQRGVNAARAAPNPSLAAGVGRGLPHEGGSAGLEWDLALSFPLGWLAQRAPRVAAAKAEVEVVSAQRQALRREVLLELGTLFWELFTAQTQVASLEELATQTRALVGTVQRRVQQGEVRPVEATRVEIELEQVLAELEAAQTSLTARQDRLVPWLHVPRGQVIVAAADPGVLPVAPSLEAARARLRAAHPTLRAAQARVRTRQAEVAVERQARLPALALTGFTAHELDKQSFGLGVAVDLPLWNWNSERIAQAEARLGAERQEVEATVRDLEALVVEAQAECRASVQTATRLGAQVVPRAQIAATTMEQTYQLGELSLLEVIDARRTLLEARRRYLRALSRAQIDCHRLGALVGEEPR